MNSVKNQRKGAALCQTTIHFIQIPEIILVPGTTITHPEPPTLHKRLYGRKLGTESLSESVKPFPVYLRSSCEQFGRDYPVGSSDSLTKNYEE